MELIHALESIGYKFSVEGDELRYFLMPGREFDSDTAGPLLKELRNHRQEAISYLKRLQRPVQDDPEYQTFVRNNDTTTKGSPGHLQRLLWEALGRRPAGVPHQID